jgi:hypothetical protein
MDTLNSKIDAVNTNIDDSQDVDNNFNVSQNGSKGEISSVQEDNLAETEKTYNKEAGANEIEVYIESGYARVRTDGNPATATTGEPLGEGLMASYAVDSVSIYFVADTTLTVVNR